MKSGGVAYVWVLGELLGLEVAVCVFPLVVLLLADLILLDKRCVLEPPARRHRVGVHCNKANCVSAACISMRGARGKGGEEEERKRDIGGFSRWLRKSKVAKAKGRRYVSAGRGGEVCVRWGGGERERVSVGEGVQECGSRTGGGQTNSRQCGGCSRRKASSSRACGGPRTRGEPACSRRGGRAARKWG